MVNKGEGEGFNSFLFHLARERFILFRQVHTNNQYPKSIINLQAKIEAIHKLQQTERIIEYLDPEQKNRLEVIANDHFLNPYKTF